MADISLLTTALTSLPNDLADALRSEYDKMLQDQLVSDWSSLQVNAGRFVEAVMRVLEYRMTARYTPIDGRSKPDRARTLNAARQDSSLNASLRQQIPMICELILDFRNNRNSAHLGNIDAGKIDSATMLQMSGWIIGELVRLEGGLNTNQIQSLLDNIADRPVSLVYDVEGHPVILSRNLSYGDTALVQLYSKNSAVTQKELFSWSDHTHSTRWRKDVLGKLQNDKLVFVKNDLLHLLPTGAKRAERVLRTEG